MSARLCLALALSLALTGWASYRHGAAFTAARYEARMAEAEATRAGEDKARAVAVAQAERETRAALRAEVERGNALAEALENQKAALARERARLNRRIHDVAERALADCRGLSLEWVRLYNEALGLAGAGAGAGNPRPDTGGAAVAAAPPGPADAGLCPEPSVNAARAVVTPEDVLAHARDYGAYCRALAAQRNALTDYVKDRP